MNIRGRIVALALAGLGLAALSSINASARIVCSPDGACWHVHDDYTYPPAAGVIIHPDDWAWKQGEHYSWREHPGRGYWRGNQWEVF